MNNITLNPRKIALFAILSALSLVIQLTPRPPNAEFTSFFTFLVGVFYGSLSGAFFGGFVMFLNGFLSPYGFAGFVMPFQMTGMAIAGIIGGIYGKKMPKHIGSTQYIETAIIGAVVALVYDLVTNVGVGLQFALSGLDITLAILTAIAYGVFFSIIHIFSNSVVFGILTLPSFKALNHLSGDDMIG
jgi:uncharacterized membrane protein